MTVRSEIVIDAPAAVVFGVLTDLDAYPEWNRFTPRITLRTADFAVGAELDLDCQMTDRDLLRGEREVILSYEPEKLRFSMGTSRKRGRPGIRSERVQYCEPLPGERTRLVNYESFEGFLAPIVRLLYDRKLAVAFARYCESVKARAESLHRERAALAPSLAG